MAEKKQFQKDVFTYFSKEPVPPEIHSRLLQTCQTIQNIPQHQTGRPRRNWLTLPLASAAALFILLCGTNAINPAFAEDIPLIGRVFQMYNENKTRVGSYVGTYEGATKHDSQAAAKDSQGSSLTLEYSYCDGIYLHLAFSMEGMASNTLKDISYISAKVTADVKGGEQTEADLLLYPESSKLVGGVSLPLHEKVEENCTLDVDYEVSQLTQYSQDESNWEFLPGSFKGSASVTVTTDQNQTKDISNKAGTVQIHSIELTPSSTVIHYTIPFWGFSSYTVDFPRLYLADGTPVAYNLNESVIPSPEEIPRDAETISGSACFDGLPNGTKTVILRFMEQDMDPGTVHESEDENAEIRVLEEVTIDLTAEVAVPSKTYLNAGMRSADDYLSNFSNIFWMMPFDDPDMIQMGQSSWKNIVTIPGLFQNGNSLWMLRYDGAFTVEFVTDGHAPERDLQVNVCDSNGTKVATGYLSHDSAERTRAGGDEYFNWKTQLLTMNGYTPKLLDHLTVTLIDPDTGNVVYQRSVRLTWNR